MVNSAIGDHGNERHQTPTLAPSLSLSPCLSLCLPLSLPLCLYLSLSLSALSPFFLQSIVSWAGPGLWSVPGQARQKDRNQSCAQPNTRTVSSLFGTWPRLSFTPGSLLFCLEFTCSLFVCFQTLGYSNLRLFGQNLFLRLCRR